MNPKPTSLKTFNAYTQCPAALKTKQNNKDKAKQQQQNTLIHNPKHNTAQQHFCATPQPTPIYTWATTTGFRDRWIFLQSLSGLLLFAQQN